MSEQKTTDAKRKLGTLIKAINDEQAKDNKDAPKLVQMASDLPNPTFIPTGIPDLDEDLGGGICRGVITTFWGSMNCGKSSVAMMLTANIQRSGGIVIWIDSEDFDKAKGKAVELGVNVDDLYVLTPNDFAEQALNTVKTLLFDPKTRQHRGLVDAIIVDSITNLLPQATADDIDDKGYQNNGALGRRGAMLAKFVESLQGKHMLGTGDKGTAMFCIAQERGDPSDKMGEGVKMSGGKALPHASKVIIRLRRGKTFNKKEAGGTKEQPVGHEIHYTVEKQAVKGPPRKGSYSVLYGIGVDDSQQVFAKAMDYGYVYKTDKKTFRFVLEDGPKDIEGAIQEMRDLIKVDLDLKNALKAQLAKGKCKQIPESEGDTE